MTRDEYEAQCRQLDADIETAYTEFQRHRREWDRLCEERRELNWQWRQQNRPPE